MDGRGPAAGGRSGWGRHAHVRFAKTSRILAEPAGGHADRTGGEADAGAVPPDVLILDDFAARQLTAAQADDLYEPVSVRQGRSLIVTGNRAPSDWYPLFPNPVVAESLLDRLIDTSHQVIMNGPGYRPNKRPKNPADNAAKSSDSQEGLPALLSVRDEIVSRMPGTDKAQSDVEHAVIARYQLGGAGFGEPGQRETVRQAKSQLTEAIEQAGAGGLDGHEFGGGEVVLFAYGPDADALFAVMAPILRDLPFRPAHVTLRRGPADDPSAAEHRVDL
ncbi:ATP-binding protein [Streptomyces sp. NPDC059533]|uniref:ATP-binding protein n=1 Tax=unclassified Streptomyces TaxID=2593676 RepID=UPI00368ABADF